MNENNDQGMDTITISVAPELKRTFKSACAANGEKMTDVILRYIDGYVKPKNQRRA